MKKYRILLLLFIVILLTGCHGNYNLKINKDFTVDESLDVNVVNRDGLYDKTISLFNENNVPKENYYILQNDNSLAIKYNNKYDTLLDYLVNSKLYKQLFEKVSYDQNNNIIKVETSSNLKLDAKEADEIINDYNISLLQISIETPFKLRSNNADDVYKNKYTWILNSETNNKKIMFSMDNISKYDKSRYTVVLISIIAIVVGVLVYVLYRLKKAKKF